MTATPESTLATSDSSGDLCSRPEPRRRPRLAFLGAGWIGLSRLNAIVAAESGADGPCFDPAVRQLMTVARVLDAVYGRAS